MEGSRTEQAILRIEAALGRLQAASDALVPAIGNPSRLFDPSRPSDNEEALRAEVAAALQDLDKLIEGLER